MPLLLFCTWNEVSLEYYVLCATNMAAFSKVLFLKSLFHEMYEMFCFCFAENKKNLWSNMFLILLGQHNNVHFLKIPRNFGMKKTYSSLCNVRLILYRIPLLIILINSSGFYVTQMGNLYQGLPLKRILCSDENLALNK